MSQRLHLVQRCFTKRNACFWNLLRGHTSTGILVWGMRFPGQKLYCSSDRFFFQGKQKNGCQRFGLFERRYLWMFLIWNSAKLSYQKTCEIKVISKKWNSLLLKRVLFVSMVAPFDNWNKLIKDLGYNVNFPHAYYYSNIKILKIRNVSSPKWKSLLKKKPWFCPSP